MQQKQHTEGLIREKIAAELLGLSVRTLQEFRREGNAALPFVKMGHAVRYRRSDIIAFIEKCTVRQPSADCEAGN